MNDLFCQIFLRGNRGIRLKKFFDFKSISNDLKFFFKVFEFFKINVVLFFLSSSHLNSNCFTICRWEKFRKKILGYFFSKNFNLSEGEIQILKEIGKKTKNGLFQYQLTKNLELKPNYMHHILNKLICFNLIKKFFCILNFNSKKSNAILLKPNIKYFSLFKKYTKKKEKLTNNEKETNLIKKLIKTVIRQKKNILTEKHLKYGICYLENIPKKVNKRQLHRKWQKIRERFKKANIIVLDKSGKKNIEIILNETIKVVSKHSYLDNFHITSDILKKKMDTWEIAALFSFPVNYLIGKIIDFYENSGITAPILFQKFRGYQTYKAIYSNLHLFEKFRLIEKNLEQFGRQKILIFKRKKAYPENKKFFKIKDYSKLICGVTNQTARRRIALLSWVKFHFIFLKDLGKKIALYEKKGLKKIDSKVIKRILQDLVNFDLLKIIKICAQVSWQKVKRFEFIVKQKPDQKQIKRIFYFLPLSFDIFKKKILTTNFQYKINIDKRPHISNNFFLFSLQLKFLKKIFESILFTFFGLKRKFLEAKFLEDDIYHKCTSKYFVKNTLEINRNFLTINIEGVSFSYRCFFNNQQIKFVLSMEKFNNFFLFWLWSVSLTLKKKFKASVISKNFIFSLKYIFNKNFQYRKIKKQTKFFIKDSVLNIIESRFPINCLNYLLEKKFPVQLFRKKFTMKQKSIKFKERLDNNFLIILNSRKKNDILLSRNKWDCELDVKFFSKYMEALNNTYPNFLTNFFKNSKSIRRRVNKLSSLTNIKAIVLFFKKLQFTLISNFLGKVSLNFSEFIKRSLEFPNFYFSFDIQKFKKTIEAKSFIYVKELNEIDKLQKNIVKKKILHLKLTYLHMKKSFKTVFEKYPHNHFFFMREKIYHFCKNFFSFLDKILKIERIKFLEISTSYIIMQSKKKKKPTTVCVSEKILLPLKIKKNYFFEKINKNFIVLVPFFVKKIFSQKKIDFFVKIKKRITEFNLGKKKYKNITTPYEVRSYFSFPIYTKDEICDFFKNFFESPIRWNRKKPEINILKTQIFRINKKNFLFFYEQKRFLVSLFYFFLKIQRKSWFGFIFFWVYFPKIFFWYRIKTLARIKIFGENLNSKIQLSSIKYFQKIKNSIFSQILEKPGFEKEHMVYSYKNFPYISSLFEKSICDLINENRIEIFEISSKSNFHSPTNFQIPFYTKVMKPRKIKKTKLFFPIVAVPIF